MKLSRLFQPHNPLFWLMVLLNALSSGLSYLLHTRELSTAATVVLALFALANAVIGIGLAIRLMRDEPASR